MITGKRRQSAARERDSVLFRDALLSANPDYTFVTDLATGALVLGTGDTAAARDDTSRLDGFDRALMAELVHPEDQSGLLAANNAARDLADGDVVETRYRGRHAGGEWHWLNRRVVALRRDRTGAVEQVLGVVRDVTDIVQAEEKLSHAWLHDALTGLPNRMLLVDSLEAALARARRASRVVAVLFCDLDGFKRINDTAGHAAGDAVLLETAHRLLALRRPGDTVARVGGDEFIIVIEPWDRYTGEDLAVATAERDRKLALRVADRIAAALRPPFAVNGVEHVVTASVGITYALPLPPGHTGALSGDEIIQDADAAMERAKRSGKDRYEVFEHGFRTDLAERGRVERVLRRALQNGAGPLRPAQLPRQKPPVLDAAYQPVFDGESGALVGFEALARLTDESGTDIGPDVFIAIAEDTGIIRPLGAVMLELACRQLAAWRAAAPGLEGVTMAVNVSGMQAQHASLGDDVRAALDAHGLSSSDLVLELTETALLQAAHSTIDSLRALNSDGVGIAIDDFGTGYASLRYLATLPASALKVDRTFTAGLPEDATSRKIVNAVAGLAADLDLTCVVEGVETQRQQAVLPEGVQLQGWLTGRPQRPERVDLEQLLQGVEPART